MINTVVLVGRVATDPEKKFTPSGVAVVNFRLAVERNYKGADGKTETDFIDVVAWRQQADFAEQYCPKGRMVGVRGSLQVRQWVDQNQQNRRNVEVVADDVSGIGPMPQAQQQAAPQQEYQQPAQQPQYQQPQYQQPQGQYQQQAQPGPATPGYNPGGGQQGGPQGGMWG